MNEIYVVMTETNDDGEIESGILDNKFYDNKDAAREAMVKDFNATKSDFDACDDIDESHSIDDCNLSANMDWSEQWRVVAVQRG